MSSPDLPSEKTNAPRALILGVCVFLAVITWIVFVQTLGHEFINFDDDTYVYANPVVTSGVTPRGVAWAFTHSHAENWHPFTTISHMVDCQLYGLKAGGHHFTNVLLHTVAVVLLFLLLREMTGALWRSAFVAAVFAIHPLHVESVAWIAERKDVLSAVFFMLTLGAYTYYTRKPSFGRSAVMSVFFVCGLLSKPMLVTGPFVLLLLDYWPLRRYCNRESILRLIREKIPLLVLAAGSCIATLLVQTQALSSFDDIPLRMRISNALVAYVTYVWQMFWPARLALFYLHPYNRLPFSAIMLATALLLAITSLAIVLRKQWPYFVTGWLWYLLMLVPVIGIIQVGDQAHADRYTYLPQIGLYLALTWAIVDLCARWRYGKLVLAIASPMIVAALAACAWKQTRYWQNSESLLKHTLAVTPDNLVAHDLFGVLLLTRGQSDEAISHFQESLNIRANINEAAPNHGKGLVHNNLGVALLQKGLLDEAISEYEKSVQLRPDYPEAHYNLGSALLKKGEINGAIAECRKALAIEPHDPKAQTTLGNALLRKGKVSEAITHYKLSLDIAPRLKTTLINLAWVLSTCPDASLRDGAQAVKLAKRAVQLSDGKNPSSLRTLAAAEAETGQFNEAVEMAQQALSLAVAQGNSGLVGKLQMDIDLYRMNFPLRERSRIDIDSAP